ncbi:MAG: class I SAM-dependent methyltransferase [Hyphomonadaceae bacterium]
MAEKTGPNADQIAYWNARGGETWVELQERLDRQIAPFGLRALAALAPMRGEHILDVGCGCGETTLQIGDAVGEAGSVLGVDVSQPMLAVAARRAEGRRNVGFVEADAQTFSFPRARFDALFSRFGVMFFADPPAAFANLRAALKPSGRLAFVCWRPLPENEWMAVPLAAARAALDPMPPPDPLAPGPFAFADAARTHAILERAGFKSIQISPFDELIPAAPLEEAVAMTLRVGPLGAALREQPGKAGAVASRVREALAVHVRDGGVSMKAAVWIVEARGP